MTHTLRKTVASVLDDADVPTRRTSDQLGHAKVSMTQDRYLGRRLADRLTAEVPERLFELPEDENGPSILKQRVKAVVAGNCRSLLPFISWGKGGVTLSTAASA